MASHDGLLFINALSFRETETDGERTGDRSKRESKIEHRKIMYTLSKRMFYTQRYQYGYLTFLGTIKEFPYHNLTSL